MVETIQLNTVTESQPIESIQEIVAELVAGKVLRVEQENNGFILVRLSPGRHKMTEISKDIEKETFYYKRHWLPYNISLNALIAFNVYLDETYEEGTNKFNVDDIVEFIENNQKDLARVLEVLIDANGKYFYRLSGEEIIYSEEELMKIK